MSEEKKDVEKEGIKDISASGAAEPKTEPKAEAPKQPDPTPVQAEPKPQATTQNAEPAKPAQAEAAPAAPAPAAPKPDAAQAEKEKPKKEKPSACAGCKKSIKKKRWYYRNGSFYCTKRCWASVTKKSDQKEETPPAAAPGQA